MKDQVVGTFPHAVAGGFDTSCREDVAVEINLKSKENRVIDQFILWRMQGQCSYMEIKNKDTISVLRLGESAQFCRIFSNIISTVRDKSSTQVTAGVVIKFRECRSSSSLAFLLLHHFCNTLPIKCQGL